MRQSSREEGSHDQVQVGAKSQKGGKMLVKLCFCKTNFGLCNVGNIVFAAIIPQALRYCLP